MTDRFHWPVRVHYHLTKNTLMIKDGVPASRCRNDPMKNPSRKRQAGVGNGGIVLVGDAAIVAENLAFFGLDQS